MCHKDISVKYKHNKIFRFKQNEWLQFASLLKSGNNLLETLTIMKVDTALVREEIESGEKLESLVLKGQKGKFYEHLSFFLTLTSLPEAIYSAYNMRFFEKTSVARLRKKSAYPLFIFLMASGSIYMFNNFIIPQLLQGFNINEKTSLFTVLQFIHIFSVILISCFIIGIITFVIVAKNKKAHFFVYAHVVSYLSFSKEYISYYLSGYMKELRKQGISSQLSFQYMDTIKENTLLSYLCKDLKSQLLDGKDLEIIIQENICIDTNFKLHYGVGIHNGTLEDSLDSYLKSIEIKWDREISKISTIIQVISYSFVGVLMVCVYQIMLIPLDMLNQL